MSLRLEGFTADGPAHLQYLPPRETSCIEVEFDSAELRTLGGDMIAVDEADQEFLSIRSDFIDAAATLELSQSLDDLRCLCWPLVGQSDRSLSE